MSEKEKERKFWLKAERAENGCLEWQKYRNIDGYGVVNINGVLILAHRAAFAYTFGDFDITKSILHHCDNPPCIEPKHLFIGTQKINAMDRARKLRGTHKLEPEEVLEMRRLRGLGYTYKELSEKFGVGYTTVAAIFQGRTWTHLGSVE